MKIGIDAYSLRREGAGRYIRDLVKYLPQVDAEHDYYVYLPPKSALEDLQVDSPRLHVRRASRRPFFGYQLARAGLDLFHATDHWFIPLPKPCPLVITFHDTMINTYPQALPRKARIYSRFMTPLSVAVADKIISVSAFNQQEILRYYPRAVGKVAVVPHGVSAIFAPLRDPTRLQKVQERYQIPPRYFLYAGSLRRYKNLPTLIEAFSLLPGPLRSNLALVIAARVEPRFLGIVRQVKALGINESVRFVGWLPPEDLVALYSSALAFISVSLYESFSYPVVEAMACGVPVIAPNHLAVPEIAQGAALLVEPHNVQAVKEAMERMATDASLRGDLIAKGLRRAKDFSWQVALKKVVQVYHEVLCR